MENSYYSVLKKNKKNPMLGENNNRDLLKTKMSSDWNLSSNREIIKGYCDELLKLLEEDNLGFMIEGIFKIQQDLITLYEDEDCNEETNLLPTIDDFFKQLAPLLLQVVWEHSNATDQQWKMLLKKFKEALRIAIEEELYVWQEKM